MIKIYCDSSTKEACYVIEGEEPVVTKYLHKVTNNIGEYRAVILAIKAAKSRQFKEVSLITDAQLIVRQVSGEYTCRDKTLNYLKRVVRLWLDDHYTFDKITLSWIPREKNLAGIHLEKLNSSQG